MADLDVHLALRAQLLTATGIPPKAQRVMENKDFTPTPGTTYLEEEFLPATSTLRSIAANGIVEVTGLYVVKLYGIADTGVSALRTMASAILAVFRPGYAFPALSTGEALRVRGDVAPWAGQILPQSNNRAVCTITVPWRCYRINA